MIDGPLYLTLSPVLKLGDLQAPSHLDDGVVAALPADRAGLIVDDYPDQVSILEEVTLDVRRLAEETSRREQLPQGSLLRPRTVFDPSAGQLPTPLGVPDHYPCLEIVLRGCGREHPP